MITVSCVLPLVLISVKPLFGLFFVFVPQVKHQHCLYKTFKCLPCYAGALIKKAWLDSWMARPILQYTSVLYCCQAYLESVLMWLHHRASSSSKSVRIWVCGHVSTPTNNTICSSQIKTKKYKFNDSPLEQWRSPLFFLSPPLTFSQHCVSL